MGEAARQLDGETVDIDLEVSEKQLELITSEEDTIVFRGGAGSGKTKGGVIWSLLKAVNLPGSRGMIVSPTYPMLEQSVLVHLTDVGRMLGLVDEQGNTSWKHLKAKRELQFPNGSSILLRSADTPERLLGADLAWVYGDEVALWQEKAYKYSVGRLRQQGFDLRQALFTFTPKGLNWAHKIFGEEHPGLHLIAAGTKDNPWAPTSFLARLNRDYGVGSKFWRQEYLGEFVAFEGLVYPHVDEAILVEDVDSFHFVEYACGVDWGWSNPGAMIVIGRTTDDVFVVLEEVSATEKGMEWWGAEARRLAETYPGIIFFCDPADPRAIDYMRTNAGVEAQKAANEVVPGIAMVGGRFANSRLLIRSTCVKLWGELLTYSWKPKADGEFYADQPLKVNDHCCDGLRYGVASMETQRRFWWQDQALVKELLGT